MVSVIDSDPKEIVLLAIHKPSLRYGRKVGFDENQISENIDLLIDHCQIDNMSSFENPVLVCPKKLLEKSEEVKFKGEEDTNSSEYTPFLQFKVERELVQHKHSIEVKFPCIMLAVQEMVVHIETNTLNNILGVTFKIFNVFGSQNPEILSSKLISDQSSTSASSLSSFTSYDRESFSIALITSTPSILNDGSLKDQKYFFDFIDIGAMKFEITLRLKHEKIDSNLKQGFGFYSIGYSVLSSIATITESPISFKELIVTHTFSAPNNLIHMIVKNFRKQAMFQFYKLIGSSDLIGNPVGFVDKIGSGVYEFVNEPKKGMLKGPKGFVGGLGKGVGSLVGNVTSATFGSFSKISGSLYSMTKGVTLQKVEREETPAGFAEGLARGAKSGFSEIASGKKLALNNLYFRYYWLSDKSLSKCKNRRNWRIL